MKCCIQLSGVQCVSAVLAHHVQYGQVLLKDQELHYYTLMCALMTYPILYRLAVV